MDIAGTFIQEMMTLIAFAMLFAGVYKIFQIATTLGEIKDLLKGRQSVIQNSTPSLDLDATAYAENLLRSVSGKADAPSTTLDAR